MIFEKLIPFQMMGLTVTMLESGVPLSCKTLWLDCQNFGRQELPLRANRNGNSQKNDGDNKRPHSRSDDTEFADAGNSYFHFSKVNSRNFVLSTVWLLNVASHFEKSDHRLRAQKPFLGTI